MAIIKHNDKHVLVVTNLHTGKVHHFQGGVNEIDDAEWGQIRGQLADKLASKKIEEIGVEVGKEPIPNKPHVAADAPLAVPVKSPQTFAKMAVGNALLLVGETYDLELLNKWKTEDNREAIVAAINKRIEAVTTGSTEENK